jgi:hypothetical protein
VKAAELLREAAGHELVLEAPRRPDRREPDHTGHASQAPRELLRAHEGLAGRIVDRDQDDRRVAAGIEDIGDERRDLALAERGRDDAAQHRRLHAGHVEDHARCLGSICRGLRVPALDLVDHQVLDQHPIADGRDPDRARAHPVLGRQREAEEPVIAVLADEVGRARVAGDPQREAGLAERGETIEPQRPLAVEEREVVEVPRGDQQLRSVGRAHGRRAWPPGGLPGHLLEAGTGANAQAPPAALGRSPWPRSRVGGESLTRQPSSSASAP